jgi:Dolichyl-phosphate-mannose-protein mannosyltransferase
MRLRQALVFIPALGALALFLVRMAQDVHGKALVEDEAVAGLIGARPLGELLGTVLWDRGGAPLHFLLVHAVLSVDSSADALRWLSVAFAVGALVTCFELGRQLAGPVAGTVALIAGATSGLLTIYGTVARMYALFAFVGGLAALLFVRALERRTSGAALAAALAAWFLPATHPYGGIAVACEAAVALFLWRGRPLRPALPVLVVCAAMLPFAFFDLRLANRFDVGGHGQSLAGPGDTWHQLELVIRGSAGGSGLTLALFFLLAAVGLVVLVRQRPSVAALTALWLLAPPLLFLTVRSHSSPDLSPRHLIYALPLWAAVTGVGAARLLERAEPVVQAAALALLLLVAAFAPTAVQDPRDVPFPTALGAKDALRAPAAELRSEIVPGDVLFPFSALHLAALPASGRACTLPRAQPELLARAIRRVELPARSVIVAVPLAKTKLRPARLNGDGERVGGWLILRRRGPMRDRAAIAEAVGSLLREARAATVPPYDPILGSYYQLGIRVADGARSRLR